MWPSTGRHRTSLCPTLLPWGQEGRTTIDGPTLVRRRAGVGPPVGSEGLPLTRGKPSPEPPTDEPSPVTVREPASAPEEPEVDLHSRDHAG